MHLLFITCTCFFVLTGVIDARDKGYDDEAVARGNAYVDKLIKEMFGNRRDFDPYVIEDSAVGFHKTAFFFNVSGEAKLHDGYIKGLNTLHRPTDCSLHDDGDRLKVIADVGAGVLDFHYSGSVKFMNYGPTISVEGLLSYIEVHMEFTVDSKTGRDGTLTKFVIDDMRGMKVWVTGLGPVNWAVSPIVNGVTNIFKRFVRNFMENKVEKHIRERIPNFQFPVEGGEDTEAPVTNPTEVPEKATPSEPETEAPGETTPPEPKTQAPEETSPPEPETDVPETEAPKETNPPETDVPETEAPKETNPPETDVPETEVPKETNPPETDVPETEVPKEINPPETDEPETEVPKETNPPEPETKPKTEAPEETNPPEPITEEPETEVPDEINQSDTTEPKRKQQKHKKQSQKNKSERD